MTVAHWADIDAIAGLEAGGRVYVGHETLAKALPDSNRLVEAFKRLSDGGHDTTLVTPLLAEPDLEDLVRSMEKLNAVFGEFEVVCNDWGLVQFLASERLAEPVVGRLLSGQATDPRQAAFDMLEFQRRHERFVHHADGSLVRLAYRRPHTKTMAHLRSIAVDEPGLLEELSAMGVRRIELSNVLQGFELTLGPAWNGSLHMCDVPIAVARHPWKDEGDLWQHPSFPTALVHRDNAIYYERDSEPALENQPCVDRLVYRLRC